VRSKSRDRADDRSRVRRSRHRAARVAGGYRFATSAVGARSVEAYCCRQTHVSVPAPEALAIVAHLQPVTKSEIESIRGVNSTASSARCWTGNLIEEGGRKDVVGRPMT